MAARAATEQARPCHRLDDRGIDPGTVHLHRQDVRDRTTAYFAGLACRYLRLVPNDITEYGAIEGHVKMNSTDPSGPLSRYRGG